jgi:hypothetical protein
VPGSISEAFKNDVFRHHVDEKLESPGPSLSAQQKLLAMSTMTEALANPRADKEEVKEWATMPSKYAEQYQEILPPNTFLLGSTSTAGNSSTEHSLPEEKPANLPGTEI